MICLLQTAIEKAIYNTTEKELKINLTFPSSENSKIKKTLLLNEFKSEENQSEYEKQMFGETFDFKLTQTSSWNSKIKLMPILVN